MAATLAFVPVATASSSIAKTRTCTSGVGTKLTGVTLCKGLSFYTGKTITVIDSGDVGSTYDVWARTLMPYVAKYLNATYEVLDVSEADGVPGQDQAASALPTGLTLGVYQLFSSISHIVAGVQGLNFNVQRLAWISGEALSTNILAASDSSGITNIAQLIADSKTTPLKMIVSATGTLSSALPRAALALLGVNVQYLTGYTTSSAEATGLLRGDGQLTFSGNSTLGALIAGGQVKALAITGKIPIGTLYRSAEDSAPTFAQLFKKYPPKSRAQKKLVTALDDITSLPAGLLALQTGVPGYKVDTMRAATEWAEKQPGFTSQMVAAGSPPKVYDPVAAKTAFIAALKTETGLGCYLTATC